MFVTLHIPVIEKNKDECFPLTFEFSLNNIEILEKKGEKPIEILCSDNVKKIKENFWENLFNNIISSIEGYFNKIYENYGVYLKAKISFNAKKMRYNDNKLEIQIENTKPMKYSPEYCEWDSAQFPFILGILFSILGKDGEFFGSGVLKGQNIEEFNDETFEKKSLVHQKFFQSLKCFFPKKGYEKLEDAVPISEFESLIKEKIGINNYIKDIEENSKKLPQIYDNDLEKLFYPLKLREVKEIERSVQEILTARYEKEAKLTSKVYELEIEQFEKKEKVIKYDEFLKEIKSDKNFIIIGPGGSGKSTISKKLCLDLIKENYIPLFFELKLFSLNKGIILYNQKNLREEYFGLKENYFEKIKNKIIILDGYDETNKGIFSMVFDYFKSFKCPIIVTGRDYLSKELKNLVENSSLYSIEPIEEKEKFLKNYEIEDKDFIKEINKNPFASKFTQTAFYLLAFYKIYKEKKEIPKDFDKFMEEFLDRINLKVYEGKGRKISKNDYYNLIKLYKEVAFQTKFLKKGEEKFVFDYELVIYTKENLKIKFEEEDIEFKNVFIRQVDETRYCFSHHLIQEYLAAKAIAEKINFKKWGMEKNANQLLIDSFFDKEFAESSEVLPMAFALLKEEKQEEIYNNLKKEYFILKTLMRAGFYNKNLKREIKKELFKIGFNNITIYYDLLGYLGWFKEKKENEKILNSLIEKLNDKDDEVRGASADAIGSLGWTEDLKFNEKIFNSLIEKLNDKDRYFRWFLAYTIGNLGWTEDPKFNEIIFNSLIKKLNDKNRYVRGASAYAIVKLGWTEDPKFNEKIFNSLLKKLNDEDEWVRRTSAHIIVKLGWTEDPEFNKKILNSLIEKLNDEDEWVRRASAYIIVKLGWTKDPKFNEKMLNSLIEKLNDKDKDVRWVSACIIVKLGRTADPEFNEKILSSLKEKLNDENEALRSEVAKLIESLEKER